MSIVTGREVRIPINGMQLNTRVDGPENLPWMVFSNSLSSSITQWDPLVAHFAPRYRTLRYDQRGHGGSSLPAPGTTMEALADDLLQLMAHFGVQKAVLVGVSMGATTVLRCAAKEPARCTAVVPCDGTWRTAPGSGPMWEERFAVVRKEGMAGMAEPTVRRWFQQEFFDTQAETVDRIRAMIAATSPEGYFACAEALQDYDFSADYPKLTVPALFVAGELDGDVPKVMREMADATPGSTYALIKNCGHLPNVEKPQELCAAM
ncbi:alpha/beta fold hydrolase, partial [Desulfovibrio sp. OttesenSCG-928-O18]|nr:alpha/beta fold hydrolase [Desulfovibrio sp. OttesenSCG-928-O18]